MKKLEPKHAFAAAVISGLDENARMSFVDRLGGMGNPNFVTRSSPDNNENSTALVVVKWSSGLSAEEIRAITYEDIKSVVSAAFDNTKIQMEQIPDAGTEKGSKWYVKDQHMPPAGTNWQIELYV